MADRAGLVAIDPDAGGFNRWLFNHARDHDVLINAAIAKGAALNFYNLDVFSPQWLFDHQRAHNDMANVTGIVNSDLETVDLTDARQLAAWLQIDALEHQQFGVALGV